jgi:hypothetical protein
MILDKFGSVTYEGYTIPNLFVDLGLSYDQIKHLFIHRQYTIIGAPRPEQLAYSLYGDPNLEWVLLLINGVIDPWHGWIRPDDVIRAYAEKKYADFGGADAIHHHVDPVTGDMYYNVVPETGVTFFYDGSESYNARIKHNSVDPDNIKWFNVYDTALEHIQFIGTLIPVTNVEYEMDKNEELRKILIIRPEDIRVFVDAFVSKQNGRT